MKKLLILILILPFFTQCTIQKRHYKKGYYINWKEKQKAIVSKNNHTYSDSLGLTTDELSSSDYISSTQNEISIPNNKSNFLFTQKNDSTLCKDSVFLKSGKFLVCNIIGEENDQIKYSKCGQEKDDYYYIEKYKINKIKYADNSKNNAKSLTQNNASKKPAETSISAILSLCFSVLSLILFVIAPELTLLFGFVSLVFGIIGLVSIRRSNWEKRGIIPAIIGIIFGSILTIIAISIIIAWSQIGFSYVFI